MPVKKTKKTSGKKTLKRDIKKAVEKLPGLIVERARWIEQPQQTETPKTEQTTEPTQTQQEEPRSNSRMRMRHNPRQTRWLWTGVVIFCLVIFSMWGWNMYVMITDATEGTGSNKGWLPDPVKDDLRTVWQEVGAPDNESDGTETAKEKIKTNLKALITQIKSLPATIATSTTTTTESL